jgi:hypothetical protein
MFDPDANVTRINREIAYLTSRIGGRSMNSRRLHRTNPIAYGLYYASLFGGGPVSDYR